MRLNPSGRSRRVVGLDKTVAQVGEVVALSGRLRLKLKPQRRDAVTVAVWTVRSHRREVKREDEEKRPAPLDAKRGYRQCSTFPLEAKNEANLGPRNLGKRRKKDKDGKRWDLRLTGVGREGSTGIQLKGTPNNAGEWCGGLLVRLRMTRLFLFVFRNPGSAARYGRAVTG